MSKTTQKSNNSVVEAKFMWMDKKGEIHYISKETFDCLVGAAEKVVDGSIKVAVFAGISAVTGGPVFAAGANPVMNGLQPLLTTIGHFAQPVCYGYLMKGMLGLMQGKDEEGKRTLKYACGGYLGAKFVPQAMDFIDTLNLFA